MDIKKPDIGRVAVLRLKALQKGNVGVTWENFIHRLSPKERDEVGHYFYYCPELDGDDGDSR